MRGKNKKDSPGGELTGLELPNSEEQKKGPGDRGYKCPHPEDNVTGLILSPIFSVCFVFFFPYNLFDETTGLFWGLSPFGFC